MASPPLPDSVELLLENIQVEKSTEPADPAARWELAWIGEQQALEILGKISQASTIKTTLSRFIMYKVRKYRTEPRTPERRRPEPANSQESVNFSGPSSPNFASLRNDLSEASTCGGMPQYDMPPRQTPCTDTPTRQLAGTPPPVQPDCTFTPPRRSAGSVAPLEPACTSTPPQQLARTVRPLHLVGTVAPRQLASTSSPWQSPCTVPPGQLPSTVVPGEPPSSVMEALGLLEFRRAFMILSYVGRKEVDDILSVDSIMNLKCLPMAIFERKLWDFVKNKGCIPESDRRKSLDWDSKRSHVYHCHVDPDGSFTFKGPYPQGPSTHLHRVLGDDNVLLVKFNAGSSAYDYKPLYHTIAEKGITVGLRRYHFFVYKDGGREERKKRNPSASLISAFKDDGRREENKNSTSSSLKCYFVRFESSWAMDVNGQYILFNKSLQEARCMFMHVHTLPTIEKYMARFQLILSKTITLDVDFASVNVERIDDIPCLDEDGRLVHNEDGDLMIHTDGTGFISEDLANKCPRGFWKGHYNTPKDFQNFLDGFEAMERHSSVRQCLPLDIEPPLLIQIRLFHNGIAAKGTLLVDKRLSPRTIQIRPSMLKVEQDKNLSFPHCNSLEVVGTSNSLKSRLSKSIILLLQYGGVPEDYFLDLAKNAILEAQDAKLKKKSALRVALCHGNMDNFVVARMILCGIPLHEPYLEHQLSVMRREEWKGLKMGRLPLSHCYNLMGTADPTGTLEPDEVCIILNNGHMSGKVLVYKHPGLHFGDIHVLNAVYVEGIEKIVGNAKYAIFFPIKGRRSLADEMANSDFDGDLYWVSRNRQLLEHFKPSKPWNWRCSKPKESQPKKPTDFSSSDLEKVLFKKFLDGFEPSYTMSEASDSWTAYMDRVLISCVSTLEQQRLHDKILKLVDIYYRALDAPKKGSKIVVPEDLKPDKYPHYLERPKGSFHSISVLGQIYDMVTSFQAEETPVDLVEPLPCLRKQAPQHCLDLWSKRYDEYRKEMKIALAVGDEQLKNVAAEQVTQKYKLMLYEAEEFEKSPRNQADIFDEALAVYQIVYNYVNSMREKTVSRCGFAWKIAGHALFTLHAKSQTEDSTIVCLKSVLQDIL